MRCQAASLKAAPVASLRRHSTAALDDWALVGEPAAVADAICRYREKLGMSHLNARTHVPGAEASDFEASLDLLAGLDL